MILKINKEEKEFTGDPQMPLLWALRDIFDMTGTKYGCGVGICGTCVVLADGEPIRSCIMPVSAVAGRKITTIEELNADGAHALQKAWEQIGVSQCGYCQPGQILTAAALLENNPNPAENEIDAALKDNICRCGAYQKIREAIQIAAGG